MAASTLARWRENMIAPFDWGNAMFPFLAPGIRIEQFMQNGTYRVRAEIPGVDKDKDIDVSVEAGNLKISVERTEEQRDNAHSEFHYGQFMRTIPLPVGAKEDSVHAEYVNGVLEVSISMGRPEETARKVPIGGSSKRAS